MAINKNKVQLQETVLDSNGHPLSSTDVNPLTSSDCVIMENGMTLEDVMGNDTVIDTPTIMNEDTSFKVGIGDSETKVIDSDVAKMVIEGKTYQNILPNPTTLIMNTDEKEFKINDKIDSSIVLDDNVAEIATVKGQTYVNVVQEESASEYVAIDEELNGQSITTTGKPEGMVKNATLEGLTLVNTIQEPSGADAIVLELDADINAQSATIDNTVQGGIKSAILTGKTLINELNGEFYINANHTSIDYYIDKKLKANNNYTVIFNLEYEGNSAYCGITKDTGTWNSNQKTISNGYVKLLLTTTTETAFCLRIKSDDKPITVTNCMLIDGDYTNQDIPYFEGMQSVKMPVLKATGKNLLDIKKFQTRMSATITDVQENSITFDTKEVWAGLIQDVTLKPNTQYTLSCNTSTDIVKSYVRHVLADSSLTQAYGGENTFSFTTKETGKISITFENGDMENPIKTGLTVSNIQLEEGSIVTTYEPFKSNILTVNEDVVLRGIGDVKDELNCLTGEVTERTDEITLDVTNVSVYTNDNSDRFEITSRTLPKNNQYITGDYSGINNWGLTVINNYNYGMKNTISYHANTYKFYIRFESGLYTAESLKQKLIETPLTLVYQLETPTIKTVDLIIQDQDNNSVKSIQAQPTLTHITTSSNGLIPFVTIPSQLKYPTIIKPSTTYTVQLKQTTVNSEFPLTINLGGTVMAVPSTKFTITTPETLTSQDVIFTGKNNVIGEVVITEGDTTGIEYPFFEGMNDVKSPKLLARGKNLFDINGDINQKYSNMQASSNPNLVNGTTIIASSSSSSHHGKGQKIKVERGEVYTCSFSSTNGGIIEINTPLKLNYVAGKDSTFTFTAPTDCDEIVISFSTRGGEANGEIHNFQLEQGAAPTPYEPYKGVTIEQSIDSIPLTSDMFEQGNILADNIVIGSSYQQTGRQSSTTRISAKTLIKVKPNCTYTLQSDNIKMWMMAFDKNGGYIKNMELSNTITTDANTYYLGLKLQYNDDSDITPSTLDSLNLTLQEVTDEIVLRSIGDVKDTLNLTTGEYVQRIMEMKPRNAAIATEKEKDNTILVLIASSQIVINNLISNKINYGKVYNRDKEGVYYDGWGLYLRILKSRITALTSDGVKKWLYDNDFTVLIELKTPIIKKVNLTNTTKLPTYASTTHYDTIVPSNSLVPNIKIPSTVDYNVAIKPSTQYTIRANTTSSMSVDLGGSTGTLTDGKVTLTTPSTLAHSSLKLGNGKAKEVMVVEGSEIKDNVPFFNGMKNVQMGGIKLVNIARGATLNSLVTANANKTQFTYTSDGTNWGKITFDKSLLKPNTKYTIKMNVISNCSSIKVQLGHAGWNYYNINNNVTGIISGTIISPPTVKCELPSSDANYFDDSFCIYFRNADSGQQTVIQNLMVIEGDWTHLDEIPYIESEMIIEQPIIRSQGKNLFDVNKLVQDTNDFGYNSGGYRFPLINFKVGKIYTISVSEPKWIKIGEFSGGVTIVENLNITKLTITMTNDILKSYIMVNNNDYSVITDVEWLRNNVQIEEGTTATSYEPYKHQTLYSNRVIGYEENCYYANGGGVKAPNTGVNSMLADVEGLSIAYVVGGSSNFTFWDKDDVFISGKAFLDTALSSYDKNGFIQVPSNAKYMRFASGNETTSNTYKTATVTGELPLRSLPNGVCDSFNLVTGEYVQRIGEIVLDGTEGYNQDDTSGDFRRFSLYSNITSKMKIRGSIVCDSFAHIVDAKATQEGVATGGSENYKLILWINSSRLSTPDVAGLQAWLKQNPITVQYELDTPIVRKIGLTAKGNYKEVELNGSENWERHGNYGSVTRFNVTIPNMVAAEHQHVFSDAFPKGAIGTNDLECINSHGSVNQFQLQIKTSRLTSDSVESLKQWLSLNPVNVGYLSTNSASLYSNIQKPIFFNNVKVQFMNDNVDIQPTLTLQSRSINSYVMDMMKANTVYTLKALANPNSFTIDGTSYSATTNGTFTSPSTLTNKLLITGLDVQELMIIEGDVTGKQLPYYKGIRSSFDNTDEIDIYSSNKNLFDMSKVEPYDETGINWWNTIIKENEVVSVRSGNIEAGQFGAYVTLDVKPNSVYKLYMEMEKDGEPFNGQIYVYENDKVWGTAKYAIYANTPYHINTSQDAKYITIGFNYGRDFPIGTTLVSKNMRLYLGEESTVYIPHSHNIATINMPTQLETVEVVKPIIEVGRIAMEDGQNNDDTTARRSKDYIPVEPGMIVTIMNGNTYRAENIRFYGINKNYISAKYSDGSGDLTIPKDCYFIRFDSGSANTSDITVVKKQYKPIALNSLPNGVKDELIINRATSSAKLVRRVGKVVLDGFSSGHDETDVGFINFRKFVIYTGLTSIKVAGQCVTSNNLPCIVDGEVRNTIRLAVDGKIVINIDGFSSINEYFNYLKQNPITVYYELAEPIITEIRLKGYPFIYEDGSISLNTDIAPVTRTSYNVNQHQLINSQNETIIRHDKQISDLYDYIEIYLDEIYRMELFKMQLELSL